MVDSRTFYYREMPEHFVFNKTATAWTKLKKFSNEIGRMYTVGPHDVERYHLRLLLLHVKREKSYEDLKTVNGRICDTFVEAAQEAGLLFDDQEYARCLLEVVGFQLPIRNVFATLLTFCAVSSPQQLWERFKPALSEDFFRTTGAETAEAFAYYAIAESMLGCGRKLQDFIPPPEVQPPVAAVLANYMQVDQAEGDRMYATLNAVQKVACDEIVNLLDKEGPKCIFIDGPGGSGKTYLYTTLNYMFKGRGVGVLNVAWSGIAATVLSDGRTVHNRFKLPVPINKSSFLSSMKVNSSEADILRNCTVIIWDEAPMAPKYALDAVNILLQDVMNNKEVFGGKLLVLGGDFRQVFPVVRRGTRADCVDVSLKKSVLWPHFKVMQLVTNMRAAGKHRWSVLLLHIGKMLFQ